MNSVPRSLARSTAERLRGEICRGQLLPGTRLAESAEAKRLGVSRVPVREAFAALEREGLLAFTPTGRTVVKELTARDFEELFAMRLLIEPEAARTVRLGPEQCRFLEEIIDATREASSLADVTRLDLDFHEALVAASGNSRLLKAWRSLRGELTLWLGDLHRRHRSQDLNTRDQTVQSHSLLLDTFRTAPADACARLARKHILGWREWLPLEGNEVAEQ